MSGYLGKRRVGIELEYLIPPSKELHTILKAMAKITGHGFKTYWKQGESNWHSLNFKEDNNSNLWVLKADGSAVTEINTPATSDLHRLRRALVLWQKEAPSLAPIAGDENCGLHVHVDVSDLQDMEEHLKLLDTLALCYMAEDHLFDLQPLCRDNSDYCCRSQDRFSDAVEENLGERLKTKGPYSWTARPWYRKLEKCKDEDEDTDDTDNWGRHMDEDDYMTYAAKEVLDCFHGKEQSISTLNLEKYGTFEFRMGATSICADHITHWAELCRNLVTQGARSKYPPKMTWNSFVQRFCTSRAMRAWAKRTKLWMKEQSCHHG